MVPCQIVFSDVDGTLLNSQQKIGEKTKIALLKLKEKGIPFVIISARSPSGIQPIVKDNHLSCYKVSYSGGLIYDPQDRLLYSHGFLKSQAAEIISFINQQQFDLTWNLFSYDLWLVKDKEDQRVKREENIVRAYAQQGTIQDLEENAEVHKILCMCNPKQTIAIEQQLKERFPEFCIVRSSERLIEIMALHVNKWNATYHICKQLGIDPKQAIAFGDHYNDYEMLSHVGYGYLMDNAPEELKKKMNYHTRSHNEDGIYYALQELNIID